LYKYRPISSVGDSSYQGWVTPFLFFFIFILSYCSVGRISRYGPVISRSPCREKFLPVCQTGNYHDFLSILLNFIYARLNLDSITFGKSKLKYLFVKTRLHAYFQSKTVPNLTFIVKGLLVFRE
jgi:hypothetical protein